VIRFMRAVGSPSTRAVVKSTAVPKRIYAIGMERVAYRLAAGLGLPVPATHLETVEGLLCSVQIRVLGRSWQTVQGVPLMRDNVANRNLWPLAAVFDVWMANTDRNPGNLLFEPDPPGAKPALATGSWSWLIDHGQCGLWPAWKLDSTRHPDDIPDAVAAITTGECISVAETAIRNNMALALRTSLLSASPSERRALLDRIDGIGDDAIREAVQEVPAGYFTKEQADTLEAFLKVRRSAADTVLRRYW
jgi:hypothetical protein